ncbi:MAG: glycosyltransferase family 2 protein [Lachnospiraceae bacterium]|nr:glycosyltransferase family 2 protein [Lachnospiraceae bacterium]
MANENNSDFNNKIIDVIIPNYNGLKFIENCLLSISKQTLSNFDTIVVDNDSTDGSAELIRERFPWVHLIRLKKNYGFARAANEGIRHSEAEYVVLLNNDTVVNKNFIENLYKAIDNKKDVFSYQAKMVNLYNKEVMDSAGDLYCMFGWAFSVGKDKPVSEFTKDRAIFSACGGAAIYRRSILDEIGLFDERHFCYLEDVDLGYRARLFGYQNRFCPDAVVYHAGSGTTGSRHNPFKVRLSAGNNIFLIYKNMPLWQICINFPFLLLGHLIKLVYFVGKGSRDSQNSGKPTGKESGAGSFAQSLRLRSGQRAVGRIAQRSLYAEFTGKFCAAPNGEPLRKGLGKEYLQGIGRGFRLCRRYSDAKIKAKDPVNYLKIQAELGIYSFQRL